VAQTFTRKGSKNGTKQQIEIESCISPRRGSTRARRVSQVPPRKKKRETRDRAGFARGCELEKRIQTPYDDRKIEGHYHLGTAKKIKEKKKTWIGHPREEVGGKKEGSFIKKGGQDLHILHRMKLFQKIKSRSAPGKEQTERKSSPNGLRSLNGRGGECRNKKRKS